MRLAATVSVVTSRQLRLCGLKTGAADVCVARINTVPVHPTCTLTVSFVYIEPRAGLIHMHTLPFACYKTRAPQPSNSHNQHKYTTKSSLQLVQQSTPFVYQPCGAAAAAAAS
jgi:hypothetical protein